MPSDAPDKKVILESCWFFEIILVVGAEFTVGKKNLLEFFLTLKMLQVIAFSLLIYPSKIAFYDKLIIENFIQGTNVRENTAKNSLLRLATLPGITVKWTLIP